jgi:cell shape-determining protein MreC
VRKKLLVALVIVMMAGVGVWFLISRFPVLPAPTKMQISSQSFITTGLLDMPEQAGQTAEKAKQSQETAEIKERLLLIQGDLKNLEQKLERVDGMANLGLIVGLAALVMTLLIVLRILL